MPGGATPRRRLPGVFAVIGPGLLVAATGVGAGDLGTAGFAGAALGPAVLWAIALGAFLKFVVTEGLARWQLATGCTILEGAVRHLGWLVKVPLLLYLLPWTFFTGAALISAAGVTARALAEPLGLLADDGERARLLLGAAQSAVAVVLVWTGGFRIFERVMMACVGVMFACVVVTAVLVRPDVPALAAGLLVPRIPHLHDGGLTWTIALTGGVGGTLTIICYGYWIREKGRAALGDLRTCRLDLATGYAATAVFGMAVLVIASGTAVHGRGAGLVVALADRLDESLGPAGRWCFLLGAWAAVFSSLLGVWQSVPYVFADFLAVHRDPGRESVEIDTRGGVYRGALLALAIVPLLQVQHPFREVLKYYAVLGAAFVPMLALVLLVLNGRATWVGRAARNRPLTVVVLAATVVFFVIAGAVQVRTAWGG